jgi:hypothetical protein
MVAHFVRPLLFAAFAAGRSDRLETAQLAADLARRGARIVPDDPLSCTLVAEGELALCSVDAGRDAAHVGAALDVADAFLSRHAEDGDAKLARAFALATLADLGGRDGLDEENCLDEIRATLAARGDGDDDVRALLLALWLARRDGDGALAETITDRIRARIAADPDARLALTTRLGMARAALDLPDPPKLIVESARAWDELGKRIRAQH